MNPISNETVKNLDIGRYMGQWYEIAKYPIVWEKDCERASANYVWDPIKQKVLVENQCWVKDKLIRTRRAEAWVPDANDKGKLLIQFNDGLPADPGPAPYWVHWTDYNYNAIVGGPSGQFLWWLSRKPKVWAIEVEPMLERVASFGYDPNKLMAAPSAVTRFDSSRLD